MVTSSGFAHPLARAATLPSRDRQGATPVGCARMCSMARRYWIVLALVSSACGQPPRSAGSVLPASVGGVWTERGGPPVAAPAGDGGYGSKLLNRGMTVQLGGSITCDWSAEGVIVTLRMTKDRLVK